MTKHSYTINLRALKATAVAASEEQARYYLNGVFVELTPERIVFTATDGHRLIAACMDYEAGEEAPSQTVSAIVPSSLIDRVKMGKKDLDVATVAIDCTQAAVKIELTYQGATYAEGAIEASYPHARGVVPRETSGEVASFNPHYLVSFEKARSIALNTKAGDDCVIAHNGGSPALVDMRIGEKDGFQMFGVIMPMRRAAWATTPPAWYIGESIKQSEAA